jgi:carbamoyltransferase
LIARRRIDTEQTMSCTNWSANSISNERAVDFVVWAAGGKICSPAGTPLKRFYIGLAATVHDSAIAIVGPSGELLFAEATERYVQRKKAYNCTPDDLIRTPEIIEEYCDRDAELLVAVTWSEQQLARLNLMCGPGCSISQPTHKHLEESTWPMPDPAALFLGLRNSISQASLNLVSSKQIPNDVTVKHYDHHLTHAANASYTSPFQECVVAVIDAYGESGSTGFFHYQRGTLTPVEGHAQSGVPSASLGFFYSRLCAFCGFDPIKGDEWKVMGLAPYGTYSPEFYALLKPMIQVDDLTLKSGCSEAELLRRVKELRSLSRSGQVSPLELRDLAHTGQVIFEEVMAELLSNLYKRGISDQLAMSGGCALNSSFNGHVTERTGFKNLHVPSAPGDDGNALGAACLAYRFDHPGTEMISEIQSPYVGSRVPKKSLEAMLTFGKFERLTKGSDDVHERAAALLAANKIIGWFQGRAEFGPRALGNRSILADPRSWDVKDRINKQIKFREEFRPFAPSILDDHGPEYFENYQTSRYMERTLRFLPEARIKVPAVVHVDGTGRLQSVRREWNQRYYDLIEMFYRLTGIPLILNTSLNVMGRPIVHSLEDALGVLFTSGLDALVVEDYLIEK